MKDKLRELICRISEQEVSASGTCVVSKEQLAKLLAILDAEGDGGEAPDDDLPGMWSNADFTGGDSDERCHAARVSEDEKFNAFRLAYYGANKSLAPERESFRRAYQTIANPARSGVVSEEMVAAYVDAVNEHLGNMTENEWQADRLDKHAHLARVARIGLTAALESYERNRK